MHGDIKENNVLFKRYKSGIKFFVNDFSLSKRLSSDQNEKEL